MLPRPSDYEPASVTRELCCPRCGGMNRPRRKWPRSITPPHARTSSRVGQPFAIGTEREAQTSPPLVPSLRTNASGPFQSWRNAKRRISAVSARSRAAIACANASVGFRSSLELSHSQEPCRRAVDRPSRRCARASRGPRPGSIAWARAPRVSSRRLQAHAEPFASGHQKPSDDLTCSMNPRANAVSIR